MFFFSLIRLFSFLHFHYSDDFKAHGLLFRDYRTSKLFASTKTIQKMLSAALVHYFVTVDDVVTGRYITFKIKVEKELQSSYRSEISFYDKGESPYAWRAFPPLPRLERTGTDGARLEPTGLLKPLQKLADGLTGRRGAVRSARMQTWLRAARFWYPSATKWTPSQAVTPFRSVILVLNVCTYLHIDIRTEYHSWRSSRYFFAESWICTGDQASAIRRRHLPRAARELDLHRGPGLRHQEARTPTARYPANRPQTGRRGAKRRPGPAIPRRGAIRRWLKTGLQIRCKTPPDRHDVVTHPIPTAVSDDLTARSPIQVLPRAGTI